MKGTGPFDDIGGKIANEFTNKDSLTGQAFGKVANEFTNKDSLTGQALKKTEEALGSVFDPDKNGLRAKIGSAIDGFKKFTEQLPADLKAGLDPNQNGVAEAFRKFGQNTDGAFQEIGRRILARAQADKDGLDLAFGPIRNELLREGSELGKFFIQQLGTKEDWKKKFEDPDTYFTIASILLGAAAAVVAAPAASTAAMGFLAMNIGLACAQALMHAAQGKPFTFADGLGIVLAIGGPAITAGMGAGYQAAYKAVFKVAPAAAVAPGALVALAKASAIPVAMNQLMWNVRGMGQQFTAVSTANMETGGVSPVDLPEPPAAPAQPSDPNRVATGPPMFVTPVPGNPYGGQGGGGIGMEQKRDWDELKRLQDEAHKKALDEWNNRPGQGGENWYKGFFDSAEQARSAGYDEQSINMLVNMQRNQQSSNPRREMTGSGRSSLLLAHAKIHRRGRRKSHDSIDSAYFC